MISRLKIMRGSETKFKFKFINTQKSITYDEFPKTFRWRVKKKKKNVKLNESIFFFKFKTVEIVTEILSIWIT